MESGTDDDTPPIDFVTLGMFIIDDIYPCSPSPSSSTPPPAPHLDIIGGAGTYSAVGARLLSPPPSSRSIAWIVDTGSDFPPHLPPLLSSWQTSLLFRPRPAGELTTRGWNGYTGGDAHDSDHRAFRYLTPKKRLTADDLPPEMLHSRSFHLICSPTRCIELVQRILSLRAAAAAAPQSSQTPPRARARTRPLMIWEPVPDLCIASELDNTVMALRHVDIVSPNHEELASLISSVREEDQPVPVRVRHEVEGPNSLRAKVERDALALLARCPRGAIGPDGTGGVVVRAGAQGCFVVAAPAGARGRIRQWVPAWHARARARAPEGRKGGGSVVDPTGGGNGFLGGFAVGLVRTGDVVEAARWGSVAASFCIEQVGVPTLERQKGKGEEEGEKWNGEDVFARLEALRRISPEDGHRCERK